MKKSHDRSLWDIRDFAFGDQGASPLHPDRAARCRCRGRAPMPLRGARGWRRQTRLQLALYAALREREGLGGEKAALRGASLPVPPAHRTHPAVKHARASSHRLGTGEGERKCDGLFPQKSGKTPRISAAPTPSGPRPPPTLTRHRHLAGRRGFGGRRTRPPHPAP